MGRGEGEVECHLSCVAAPAPDSRTQGQWEWNLPGIPMKPHPLPAVPREPRATYTPTHLSGSSTVKISPVGAPFIFASSSDSSNFITVAPVVLLVCVRVSGRGGGIVDVHVCARVHACAYQEQLLSLRFSRSFRLCSRSFPQKRFVSFNESRGWSVPSLASSPSSSRLPASG